MSIRINEDRLKGPIEEAIEENENLKDISAAPGSLKFITPTELVDLPSKGLFYREGHPLRNQETVEIKHMTTKEEDILTSVTLLRKGLALDRMLENILVNRKIKVDDLLSGDKSALIVAARIHGYGAEYETAVDCPHCQDNQTYSFELNSLNTHFPGEEFMKEHKIERTDAGTFLIPLPTTQYTIETKLLTGHDEKKISETKEYKKKKNFPETYASDYLRFIIVSINGIENEASINEFIDSLPAIHARHLRKLYDNLSPSLDMKHSFRCSSCDYEGVLEVPLTANFFWSNT